MNIQLTLLAGEGEGFGTPEPEVPWPLEGDLHGGTPVRAVRR